MNELKTRRDVELEYDVNEYGIITSPGKFEAEMWYAPIVWGWVLNGCEDETTYEKDGSVTDYIKVNAKDRRKFGLEPETYALAIWSSDQGFVRVAELTEEEYQEWTEPMEDENGEGNSDY